MDLDILFLGRLLPKEYENEIKAKMKSGMVDAANALQWNIIAGMEANCCGKLKILNYLPVGSFPNGYKDLYIKKREFEHSGCKYSCGEDSLFYLDCVRNKLKVYTCSTSVGRNEYREST